MRARTRWIWAAMLGLAAVPAQAQTSAPAPDAETVQSYRDLARADQRVAAIGYRLAHAARDWCSDTVPSLGWLLTDRLQYPAKDQRAAAMAYNTLWPESPDIIIAAISPDSPAARARFHVGEAVVAIDGEELAALAATSERKKRGTFSRMGLIEQAMDRWLADGKAEVRVRNAMRNGQGMSLEATVAVKPERICATRFAVRTSNQLNGGADGERVQVTSALADYAVHDEELASVLAHEFAHNILKHRLALNSAGVTRGLLQEFGKNARLTRETEEEADRLSVWLLMKAGYDPGAAARFWARFGPEHDGGILRSRTHGSWKSRLDAMQAEAERARTALTSDRNARPPLVSAVGGTGK